MFKIYSSTIMLLLMALGLYACPLCSINDPKVLVDISLYISKDKLDSIELAWNFSTLYSKQAITLFDTSGNGQLEEPEHLTLQSEFYHSLYEKQILTTLLFDSVTYKKEDFFVTSHKVAIEEEKLILAYTLAIDKELQQEHHLGLRLEDKDRYFAFFPQKSGVKLHTDNPDWQLGNDTNLDSYIATLHVIKQSEKIDQSFLQENIVSDKLPHYVEEISKSPLFLILLFLAFMFIRNRIRDLKKK